VWRSACGLTRLRFNDGHVAARLACDYDGPMLEANLPNGVRNRINTRQLLRHCGYGVPSLERALYSASSSLSLMAKTSYSRTTRSKRGNPHMRHASARPTLANRTAGGAW
jgi:hypothetical protein